MLKNQENLNSVIYTVSEILKADNLVEINHIFTSAEITAEETGYDNWNGGISLYSIRVALEMENFIKIRDSIQNIENIFLEKFHIATRHFENIAISLVLIAPKSNSIIDWSKIQGITTQSKLVIDVRYLKDTMISVATKGQRIQDVNDQYIVKYNFVSTVLKKLNIVNPNPYRDLWDWYNRWTTSLYHYSDRRVYISNLYARLLQQLLEEREEANFIDITVDLTEWEKIGNSINEIRSRQQEALTPEQFQVIGLLSRETIITLAQAVFDKEKHLVSDGKEISKTDAKRMLESYISSELSGSSNETLRRYARATLDLANELTHKRTATKKEASLCANATISIINLIGTIEGRV